jgi:hypothetical protein
MRTTIWHSLVAETQFATELTLIGPRRLCSVPLSHSLRHLRLGILALFSNSVIALVPVLEVLCKLQITLLVGLRMKVRQEHQVEA